MLLYGCITGPEIVGLKINPNTPAGISLLHIVFIQICCFFYFILVCPDPLSLCLPAAVFGHTPAF